MRGSSNEHKIISSLLYKAITQSILSFTFIQKLLQLNITRYCILHIGLAKPAGNVAISDLLVHTTLNYDFICVKQVKWMLVIIV